MSGTEPTAQDAPTARDEAAPSTATEPTTEPTTQDAPAGADDVATTDAGAAPAAPDVTGTADDAERAASNGSVAVTDEATTGEPVEVAEAAAAAEVADDTTPAETADDASPAEAPDDATPAETADEASGADAADASDSPADEPADAADASDSPADEPADAPLADAVEAQADGDVTSDEASAAEPEPVADAPVTDAEAPPADGAPAAPDASDASDAPAVPAGDAGSAGAGRPAPRPAPRPRPRPQGGGRQPAAEAVAAPAAPPAPPALSPAEEAEAATFGRVDEDGTVHVREAAGERVVGQYPGADPAEALAFYVRRYADLHAKVALFESRLGATDLAVKEIDTTLEHLATELAEPAAVGDLDALRARLETLRGVAAERRAAAEAERAAARREAVEARTAIVEAAEKIAGTDPDRMQWRPAGEQLRTLLDQWKDAQRQGPRIDRPTEDALWKRFSHARSVFDRERRKFFAELEKHNAEAKAAKERLVADAERLAGSTDWGPTTAAYRDLMTRWKAAGRASRKDDDALWARFRAAQDRFFAARDETNRQIDAEYAANLEVKLALLEEAERLVPVTDLGAAKAALRDLQDRWERAGKVPRADVQRVEGRLRAVEQAVRDADQAQWRRTNPETRARAEGAAAQLHAAIAALEADLASAEAAGDRRRVDEARSALEARRAWLAQVERAAAESRG